MSEPVFTTRDELVAWVKQRTRLPDPSPTAMLDAVKHIRRVTLAHSHLLGEA